MPTSRPVRRHTVAGAALVVLLCVSLRGQQVQQNLLVESFAGTTTPAPVYGLNAGFTPCLTAGPVAGAAPSSIPNCNLPQPDPVGQGTLRFTEIVQGQASAVVYDSHLPTVQGLSVTFTQYQYGGFGLGGPGDPGGADGIVFFLAVAPPLPGQLGPQGGALGYASDGSSPGLPNGWLGIGLDAFGNFANGDFGGASCVDPAWAGGQPDAITVRGPEHDGYCLLSSSAESGPLPGGVSLRGPDRAASKRTIQVLIDPIAGTYTVSIDPAGGTAFQVATLGPLPSSYFDPGALQVIPGYPDRLTFGFSAATGSATDFHEISDVTVTTIAGSVPVINLTKTNTLTAPPVSDQEFEYILTPRVDGTVPAQFPIQVQDFLPAGMSLTGTPTGSNWNCFESQSIAFTCSYNPIPPYAVGTVFPEIRVPVRLDSGLQPGTVLVNTASSFTTDSAEGHASNVVTTWADLAVVTTSLPGGTVGNPYSAALVATGGATPYTWALASGALPPGLDLNPDGSITGTPTAGGSFGLSVEVIDSIEVTASQSLSIIVSSGAVTVTTTTLPDGTIGAPYNASVAASGGTGAITWSVDSGNLPAGLGLAANGAITGTPTATGLANFTVRATDSVGAFATRALAINIAAAPVTITTASLPGGTVGTAYNASVAATGGTGAFTWTLDSGAMPAGLLLALSGAIAGTPTVAGLANFTVRATDSVGAFTTRALSIDVVAAAVAITTATLPGGTVGTAYNASVAATGGTGAITWTLNSGSLPAGLGLTANGAITGTPTVAGLANFTVRATDSVGAFTTRALSIDVVAAAVAITTATLPGGTVGTAYNASVAATGGTGAITWTLNSGSLPAGLGLAANGAITGTPTAAGLVNFTVRATDSVGAFATGGLSINVAAAAVAITTASLPGGTVGTAYNASVAATGGTGAITWTLNSGSLPAGLGLAANGAITGTPSAAGLANFTVRATDSVGAFATRALSINIVAAAVAITTASLPGGTVGTAYNSSLAATGGTGAITWSLNSGSLPAGLGLAANGAITGTPTAVGLVNFTVRATDSVGAFGTLLLSINVTAAPVVINTSGLPAGPGGTLALPGGTVGTAYNAALAATGGTGAFTWTLDSGALPAGLSLASSGAITGTPTTAGLATFTARATDSVGAFGTLLLSINIAAAPVVITTSGLPAGPGGTLALPGGTVGTAYNAALAATGGTGAFTWTLDSGALPAGLSLASSGAITGTPTTAGLATFTARATDSVGAFGTLLLSINVTAAPVVITTSGLPAGPGGTLALPGGTVGTAYNAALAATGGTGAFTWSLNGGALPAGLSLASNGAITGTPTAAGLATFTSRATDSVGAFGTLLLSINVTAAPVVINTSGLPAGPGGTLALPGGTVGTVYGAALSATGGTGAFTWTLDSGALPAGLGLASNGAITGTPTTAGLATFTARATDSVGAFGTLLLSINVVAAPVTINSSGLPAGPGGTLALPGGTVGTVYTAALTATGGTGAITWSLNGGSLPAGLGLASNGAITGTPTTAGLATFTARATDSVGAFGTLLLSINVTPALVTINTSGLPPGPGGSLALPGGTVGTVYTAALTATGGTGAITWSLASGALPAGLGLASNGAITGTPTAAGLATFTARATDSVGAFGTLLLSINVVAGSGPLRITTTSVPNGRVGVPYNAPLAASGGTAPYTWRVVSGQLPAGLSLSSAGAISGTPTNRDAGGRFEVRVTDSAGRRDNRFLQIQVSALQITTTSLPSANIGNFYLATLSSTGGFPIVRWTLDSGALPAGLGLNSWGDILGVPAAVGTFAFAVRATDNSGASVTRALTLTVTSTGSVYYAGSRAIRAAMGVPFRTQLSASSFPSVQTTYTWEIVSGSLPPGLSLSPDGVISGTPSFCCGWLGFDFGNDYLIRVRITNAYGWVGVDWFLLMTYNNNPQG